MGENEKKEGTQPKYEEGALKIHKLTQAEVVFSVVGCGIGSGCLGTAYSARLAGLPVLVFWFIVTGILTLFSMMYVAETTLRTRTLVQLPGLAERYLGPAGSILIFIAVVINSLSCMIAYFSGSGKILNELRGVQDWVGTLIFLIPAAGVAWFGLKAMGVGNKLMSIGMIVMLVVLTAASMIANNGDLSRIFQSNWTYAIPIFNVAAFSYIGQYLVPDLARGLSHDPKKLAPAIALGQLIVCVLLIIVPMGVMYITPAEDLTQVATIAWGRSLGLWALYIANIFALIAMLTSYWAISQTLLSNIVDKFKFHSDEDVKIRLPITIVIVGIPLALTLSGAVGFVDAIYFSGTFAGAIMAILPIFMLKGARKKGEIEPDWNCGWMYNSFIQGIIILLYSGTIEYAILGAFKLLPAGW